ncbi:MAG: S8 family serine peptidase [Deltaproteobacteria bacterium]|nr:S8 family serine peptidase [Deltaproteobacteria bacterium]
MLLINNEEKIMRQQALLWFRFILPTFLLLFAGVVPAATAGKQVHPTKISSQIRTIRDTFVRKGLPGVRKLIQGRRVVLETDRIEIVLEFKQGTGINGNLIRQFGGSVGHRYRNRLVVKLPLDRIPELSTALPGLEKIRLPYRPFEVAESEGVSIMGATDHHAIGVTGSGVKVAIIDLGFQNLTTAQNAGEVPANVTTVDYTGSGIQATTKHGTAVAEVIHDMAPDAQLYLLKIGNDVDLGNAKDYCITHGIRVINHSVAWFGAAFYDGTGPICDIANDAYNHGILWVNAAGNYGNMHYQGTMTDTDNDRKHEFTPNDEALSFHDNVGVTLQIIMDWDAYPTTYDDYDLFLYDIDPDTNPGAQVVASSQNNQGPTWAGQPYENLVYTAPASATYYLVIKKKTTGDADHALSVFFLNVSSLEYRNRENSLAQPADATGVLAAGAVNLTDNLRGYSSRGPTNDGRIKPDVTATDGVTNSIYGTFYGTSAASPHTAGAAALLLEQDPTLTVSQLMNRLESETIDLGSSGKDNLYGAGRISLDADGDGLIHDLELQYGANPLVRNTDSDGLLDGEEVLTYNTDPVQWDTDGDSFSDGEEVTGFSDPLNPQSVPQAIIGDIAPHGNPDGTVDAADAMIALRIASGLITPTALDLGRGDIYPQGNPDGVIDLSDALLIMRKAMGITK